MALSNSYRTCPNCGTEIPAEAQVCPNCGEPLPPQSAKAWFKNLNAAEIFLLILGSIMLLIGLVAV
ncbi:zinc-ribbon domain-containing protein [Pontibacter locisalis]|uniref:Zinc-ribbon domain-containing protein n=1 Tax=Pontibacter locisalis TaxID=1719035 RepID=A0ABW5IL70_9BACT